MSAPAGKKGKKKAKAKTVSLNDFLGDTSGPGVIKQLDWADEAEDDYRSINSCLRKTLWLKDLTLKALTYQSTSAAPKVIQLPTAPRASRTIEIDHSRIPENGPFTAFVGNLPFEVDEYLLQEFFKGLEIVNVRLPEENGRFKGYGYVQFSDKQSLVKALGMNEETLQKRNLRIDIADNQNKDSGSSWGRSRNTTGPDPTEGNWRKAPPDEGTRASDFQDRRGSYRNDEYDGSNRYRKSSRDYDGQERRYGDRQGYGQRGFSDRSGFDRNRQSDDRGGFDRPRYGSRGYDRQGSDGGRYGREEEAPRERPQLRLQPRQKPLDKVKEATTRSSSIFGSAKPVDTAAKERVIEEKLDMQQKNLKETTVPEKKSSSIFGGAKPIDTSAREREIEEKIAAQKERLLSASKQPSVSARSSVFGDAKPVDTSAREKEIDLKLRKKEEELLSQTRDVKEPERRSRVSSHQSEDRGPTSPRRSRNSSVRSSDDHMDGSSSQKSADGAPEARKSQYKPAPPPKENAWGRKPAATDKPSAVKEGASGEKPIANSSWSRGAPRTDQRGEREEAEGSREDVEERMPEGATDEERAVTRRGQPGDGSESDVRSYSSRRDVPRYNSDRTADGYQDRNRGAKAGSRPGTNQHRNSDGSGYRDNRRRGDGDSQSYRGGASYSGNSSRNRREGSGRSRNENNEKRRDSSRDSRPECDRSEAAGQEQSSTGAGKSTKPKLKVKTIEKEKPVDFVSQSKFALLSVDDSDEEINA